MWWTKQVFWNFNRSNLTHFIGSQVYVRVAIWLRHWSFHLDLNDYKISFFDQSDHWTFLYFTFFEKQFLICQYLISITFILACDEFCLDFIKIKVKRLYSWFLSNKKIKLIPIKIFFKSKKILIFRKNSCFYRIITFLES